MCLSSCILCVPIYYNVPDLLPQSAGNGQSPVPSDSGSDRRHPDPLRRGGYFRMCFWPSALLRWHKGYHFAIPAGVPGDT